MQKRIIKRSINNCTFIPVKSLVSIYRFVVIVAISASVGMLVTSCSVDTGSQKQPASSMFCNNRKQYNAEKQYIASSDKLLSLADNQKTVYKILLASNASESEQYAAMELASFLKQVTSAEFPIINETTNLSVQAVIAVGPDAAKTVSPDLDLSALGQDGIVLQTVGSHLILTGGTGSQRGTLYAVYKFLEDIVGCRWWTPSVSDIPYRSTLEISSLHIRHKPVLEYRTVYAYEILNQPDWAVRNMLVGDCYKLDGKRGNFIGYTKKPFFVHTFNRIIPPEKYFPIHPEWFSEINGKRTGGHESQLCLTNPELLHFMIARAREYLRASPPESIISISQNDNNNRCQCKNCLAIEKIEQGHSGPLLRFVNSVADALKDEFPKAKIDTLAYRYTQQPPVLTKPHENVVIRLCAFLNSYDQPMDAPINRQFSDDIRNWSEIHDYLYIWDYITDFKNYMRPFPNKRVLGEHIRFFVKHGVRGIFSQSNYQSPGGEFADLKSWVLTKLLWNPNLDDQELVNEFVKGYYRSASPYIIKYINLLEDNAAISKDYKHSLLAAELLFKEAEQSVKGEPELIQRVQLAHASVYYGIIKNYIFCSEQNKILDTQQINLQPLDFYLTRFKKICKENHVTFLSEHKIMGEISYFVDDIELKQKQKKPDIPDICKDLNRNDWFEIDAIKFRVWNGELSEDTLASTGLAICMQTEKTSWSTQLHMPNPQNWVSDGFISKENIEADWNIYASIRIELRAKETKEGIAFAYGIYDITTKKSILGGQIPLSKADTLNYRFFKIGITKIQAKQYIWVGPVKNNYNNIKSVWIDRIVFIKK